MISGAVLSHCGTYRYRLWRAFDPGPRVAFVMLNPSTADAAVDDPTIRRCVGYARTWGYDGVEVANLYALRATNPYELENFDDPVGPENDVVLGVVLREAAIVVCAWGATPAPRKEEREATVQQIARDLGITLYCIDTTRSGDPKHPLYLRANLEPRPWRCF